MPDVLTFAGLIILGIGVGLYSIPSALIVVGVCVGFLGVVGAWHERSSR